MKQILTITFFLCALLCNAQISVNSNQLNGTRYKLFYPTESYRTEEIEWADSAFFIKQYYMPDIFVHKIASFTIKRPYYLSDSIPAAFDHTKVGSSTSGKYLLLFNKKSQTITYYTIVAFDEATISLFYKMPDKDKKVDASDWEKNYIKISQCAPIEVQNDAVKCRLNANDHTAQIFDFGEYELELDDNKIDSPSTFTFEGESYTITSVADSAFAGCTQLVRAKLPNGVTKIGKYAFRGCNNLNSVALPTGLTSLETGLFEGCLKLKSAIIPESVTHIKSNTFNGCKSLKTVTIPASVTQLDDMIFRGCRSLDTIICNATSVPLISAETFSHFIQPECVLVVPKGYAIKYLTSDGWNSFKSIIERSDFVRIGSFAYSVNIDLQEAEVEHPAKISNQLEIPSFVLHKVPFWAEWHNEERGRIWIEMAEIRHKVTSIADSAFVNCTSLTSVTIPGSVQKPGMYSFRGCKNLTSATLQEGIPYVDTGMFVDCEKLTSVSIPESVTHIWSVAFSGCKSLASLKLPSKLAKIEGTVFRNCPSLKTITCLATTPPELRADGTTFNGFDRSQCTLVVPKGCAAKYRAATGWKEFKEIVEQTF